MKYLLIAFLVIPLLLSAQDFTIKYPGAAARSLGGAYIALAEDVTAAFWNPAGLAYIRNYEIYLSGNYKDYRITSGIKDFYKQAYNNYNWNDFYFGFRFPVAFNIWGHRLILNVAFAFHEMIDFNHKYRAIAFSEIQEGGINAYTVAVGYPHNDKLYFGFSYCLFDGDRNLKYKDSKDGNWWVDSVEKYSYCGYGSFINLGFLYNPKPFRFGLIIKSPSKLTEKADNYKSYIQMPFIFGIGLAYNFTNRLTYSADFQWIEYKNFNRKFEQPFERYRKGDAQRLGSKNAYQVRLGSEYAFEIKRLWIPLRIGIGIDRKMYIDLNDHQIQGSFLTGGFGLIFGNFTIDWGIEFNKTPYRIPNQGSYDEQFCLYMVSIKYKKATL